MRVHGGPGPDGPARWDFSTGANAAGPCPAALAAVQAADCTRYPDPAHTRLRERLAQRHGVARWRILIAASGSEAIQRLTAVSARLAPGPVSVPPHAYGDYAAAARAWGRALEGGAGATLHWQADPSSPHGQDAPPLAGAAGWCVLDCAYAPLRLRGHSAWTAADRDAVFQLITPNKALGLTGVRGAYLIAPADDAWRPAAAALDAAAPSWPLGAHGEALLHAWCEADAWLADSLLRLRDWQGAQTAWLAAQGIAHQPSVAPHRLARIGAAHVAALRTHGVALRDATSFGLPGWARISVQPPSAQAALEAAWLHVR